MRRAHVIAGVAVATLFTLAACGSGDGPSSRSDAGSEATVTTGTPNPGVDPGAGKVDANKASVSELTAALTAAGVPSANRWAKEVEEYRPYPTDDATFAKLRQNLAKYNPGDDVVEKIVSALSL